MHSRAGKVLASPLDSKIGDQPSVLTGGLELKLQYFGHLM